MNNLEIWEKWVLLLSQAGVGYMVAVWIRDFLNKRFEGKKWD